MLPSRQVAALLTALAGAMNIISALYPAVPARMELLRDVLPLHLIRGSETATVLVGFALVLLAEGLRKRRRRALQLTITLLLLSALLNLTKGLDFEEAITTVALAAGLFSVRHTFSVPSRAPAPRAFVQRAASFVLLYYAYVLGGFLILRHVIRPIPTALVAAQEPVRLLLDAPFYHYLTGQARWFERSLIFIGSAALLYLVIELLRPLLPRRTPDPTEAARVRSLVRHHGADTLSYFSLQDGRSYFFDDTGSAVLSYRLWGNVALVGGHPVGAPSRIPDLIRSFLEYVDSHGMEVCFLGISGDSLGLYKSLGLRTLKIGEEAIIDLPDFQQDRLKRKVRRAVRHVSEAGIRAVTYSRRNLPGYVLAQMEEISRAWVESKGGNERGFSMTLGRIPRATDDDTEIVVAMEGDYVWGYLCLVPVYQAAAWSLDSMRRRPESLNGLTEFLIVHAAESYRARGYQRLSLNFATLSNSEGDIDSRALEGTRRFLFEHMSSFYQLKTLYHFNSKFQPRWQSRYMAYRDVLAFPKLALAIVQAEDPVRLPSLTAVFRR